MPLLTPLAVLLAASALAAPVTRPDPTGGLRLPSPPLGGGCAPEALSRLLSEYLGDVYQADYPDVVAYFHYDEEQGAFTPPNVCLLVDGKSVDVLYDEPQLDVVVFSDAPMDDDALAAIAPPGLPDPAKDPVAKAKKVADAAVKEADAAGARLKQADNAAEALCGKKASGGPDANCLLANELQVQAAEAARATAAAALTAADAVLQADKAAKKPPAPGKVIIRIEGYKSGASTALAPSNPGGGGLILPSDDPFRTAAIPAASTTEFKLVRIVETDNGDVYRARAHFELPAQSRVSIAIHPDVAEAHGGQTTVLRFDNVLRRWVGFGVGLGVPVVFSGDVSAVSDVVQTGNTRFYLMAQVFPGRVRALRPRTGAGSGATNLWLNSALVFGAAIDGEFPETPFGHLLLGVRVGMPTSRPWSHIGIMAGWQLLPESAEYTGARGVLGVDYSF